MWRVHWKKSSHCSQIFECFFQHVSQNMNMTSFWHVRFPDMSALYCRKQMMCSHCDGEDSEAELTLAS